jgi:hypothetical protein
MLKHRIVLNIQVAFRARDFIEGSERVDVAVLTLEGAAIPVR